MKKLFILLSISALMPFCAHAMDQGKTVPVVFKLLVPGPIQSTELTTINIPQGKSLFEAVMQFLSAKNLANHMVIVMVNNMMYDLVRCNTISIKSTREGQASLDGLHTRTSHPYWFPGCTQNPPIDSIGERMLEGMIDNVPSIVCETNPVVIMDTLTPTNQAMRDRDKQWLNEHGSLKNDC